MPLAARLSHLFQSHGICTSFRRLSTSKILLDSARFGGIGRLPRAVAKYSLASALGLLLVPLAGWPIFDAVVLPKLMEQAIRKRKFVDAAHTGALGSHIDVAALEERLRLQPGQLIIVVGPGASEAVRQFANRTGRSCAFIDSAGAFDRNPYELASFMYLGALGELINTYTKMAIFLSSILSARHPHVDSYLYTHNVQNNVRRALEGLRKERLDQGMSEAEHRPAVVIDHVEVLLEMSTQGVGLHQETVSFYRYSVTSLKASSGVARLHGLATYVWAVDKLESLTHPALRDVVQGASVLAVQGWGRHRRLCPAHKGWRSGWLRTP